MAHGTKRHSVLTKKKEFSIEGFKKRREFLKNTKPAFRALDLVRGQGVSRFKSGAYTLVREHFEAAHNTAIGQEIMP